MNAEILLVLGGIGLFLLGMVILTDGLRHLAGDSLRQRGDPAATAAKGAEAKAAASNATSKNSNTLKVAFMNNKFTHLI